jgi:hypothetical protein
MIDEAEAALASNGDAEPAKPPADSPQQNGEEVANAARFKLQRAGTSFMSAVSTFSKASEPPPGSVLTGKQEHCKSDRRRSPLPL